MVEIEGPFCTALAQSCLRKRLAWQCKEFATTSKCVGPVVQKHYCIDRYEWPNRAGDKPSILHTWHDASASCIAAGKRLCTEDEWSMACEGPEQLPFPYGYSRDASKCAIDKTSPKVDEKKLRAARTRDAEVARLDQREPSGARPGCVSGYGVFDLTGNVDEWVVNETRQPYRSALKGGNWGEYRQACRPSTRAHDEGWWYYQTGFRCCRDAGAPPAAR